MKDKIKALLDVGMPEEQIMSILGLTEDEYLNALYETEEPVEEAPEENEEEFEEESDGALPELEEYSGKPKGRDKMSEEEFNLVKELRDKGYYNGEIAKHLGRSRSFIQQITSNCKTYADLEKYRTKVREYQRKLYEKNRAPLSAQRREERKKQYEEDKKNNGFNRPYTAEEFNEAKQMKAESYSDIAIARKQHRSQSFINRVVKYETYDELLAYREKDKDRKHKAYVASKELKKIATEKKADAKDEIVPTTIYAGRNKRTSRPTKINEEIFYGIKDDYDAGFSLADLVRKYNLGRSTISRITHCESIEDYFKKRRDEHLMYDRRYKVDDDIEFEGESKSEPEISPELVELRTMNDYLARIVEAIESKPKKRGLFRK